jgi:polysaccharide export outer membrane protein
MTYKKHIINNNPLKRVVFLGIFLAILLSSCVTPRRVNYLQDMTQGSQIELENRFEAVIAPYDQLVISVSSPDKPELATPFNSWHNDQDQRRTNSNQYLVDVNGDIEMPTLGRIHVAGLTRLRLQDTLASILRTEGYISNPFVNVHFNNFKIFFLGSGQGKVITITNERCTFLEALAMLGGLDPYTRRDRIAVMREIDGRMVIRYLDPRSSDVFNDPFFMLQQNDFIITESMSNGVVRNEVSYWTGLAGTFLSLTSLLTTLMLYRSMSK